MLKLSLDNPVVVPLSFLFFGMTGYVYELDSINWFDILFISLQFFLFLFLLVLLDFLERKKFPSVINVDDRFSWFVIFIKLFFLVMLVKAGPVDGFDNRLSVFNSSFLLGINSALNILLFPLIPALTKKRAIFWGCVIVWFLSSLISLLYAPSKSYFIGVFFSILFYRFLKRKMCNEIKRIPLFSFKTIAVSLLIFMFTSLLLYHYHGEDALNVLMHRVAYNYDIAIYISSIYSSHSPEHGIIYYAILPILKQFDSSLYSLDFFSIPQWTLFHALGIERFGRFGYPNDNFAAGMLASYGLLAIPFFIITLVAWFLFVKCVFNKSKVGLLSLYLIFQIPLFYSSLQDYFIYFYVVFFLYVPFLFFKVLFLQLSKSYVQKDNSIL